MYRRKNKKYEKTSHNTSTEQCIYDLFNTIRYNKSLSHFQTTLATVLEKQNTSIENISYQGNNLLTSASMFGNELVFNYLIENHKDLFESYLPKCILFIYPNKNPNILKTALQALGIPSEDFKNQLAEKAVQHCYRTENIQIFKVWFEKYFNENEILKITTNLIINNNKPFLSEICFDDYWKKQTLKAINECLPLINLRNENYFFHKITSLQYQTISKDNIPVTDYNISLIRQNSQGNTNKKSPVVEVKKTNHSTINQTISKEKIGLKENHKPIVITKKRVSIS